jgi:septation ring formation regulator EzrA
MKAKKLTANQVKNLINEVKEIYRLCGFETGKRTNLQKALKECRFDYAELGKGIDTSLCYPENVFNKEYQNEKKGTF